MAEITLERAKRLVEIGSNNPKNLTDMKNIGAKLMTVDEFVKSLPNPPKDGLIEKIRRDLEERKRGSL